MTPLLCRMLAAAAHRRASGQVPAVLHNLWSGETHEFRADSAGFTDAETGQRAMVLGDDLVAVGGIDLRITAIDDVAFAARIEPSGESVTGRAGGGTSVTLHHGAAFHQYAVGQAAA